MTYVATLSHMRRINTPTEKTGKLVQPRKLHPTQWGIVCPSETPEGASVGLVKNMALLTNVTIVTSSEPVRLALLGLGLRAWDEGASAGRREACVPWARGAAVVFVNGDPVGAHDDPQALRAELRALKRSGAINVFTSIAWNVAAGEVCICTEGGRFVRPMLVVDPGTRDAALLLPANAALARRAAAGVAAWHELVLAGAIEYIDADEANCSRIGFLEDAEGGGGRCDLLEVSRSAMLGVVAGSIPYSDHNQAPRNTYQSAMGKQAMGIPTSNFVHRFDTRCDTLDYPQCPMVSTETARILNCDRLPCGINAIVAIACFTGFNQVTFFSSRRGGEGAGPLWGGPVPRGPAGRQKLNQNPAGCVCVAGGLGDGQQVRGRQGHVCVDVLQDVPRAGEVRDAMGAYAIGCHGMPWDAIGCHRMPWDASWDR